MSRTKTQTASRPLDHLYDPNYTVSGPRDFAHVSSAATRVTVMRAPVYDNMFSDNASAPRSVTYVKPRDPIPPSVDRTFHANTLSPRQRDAASSAAAVSGGERSKFFRMPLSSSLTAPPIAQMVRTTGTTNPLTAEPPAAPEKTSRTVAVQTLYTEREAQTDPYSPPIKVADGENPELLTLQSFKFGHGLPASLAEVEMIEKAREKRAWEAQLPPLDDPDSLPLREQMMKEMEVQEWSEREKEIERLQAMRLNILRQVIEAREQENESLNDARVQEVFQRRTEEKEATLRKIEKERVKVLRKLTNRRMPVEKPSTHRDIVDEYADFGSTVYAPLTREGTAQATRPALTTATGPTLNLTKLQTLTLIENRGAAATDLRIRLPSREMHATTPSARSRLKIKAQLETMGAILEKKKNKGEEVRVPLTCTKRVEKPPPRPPTPEVDAIDLEQEAFDAACVELQRLLRGRAVQNRMFEGKERRLPLIEEIRVLHAVSEEEKARIDLETQSVERERAAVEEARVKQAIVEAAVSSGQGEVVAQTLVFLSQELVRLREERRIAALTTLAARERRARESEESGRRAQEEARRGLENELFRQIMATHYETVDSYLESILMEAVETTASRQSMHEARLKARMLDTLVDRIESAADSPETIVRDLVGSFLFPEVERQTQREQVAKEQRRFLDAAGPAVVEALAGFPGDLSSVNLPPLPSRK